MQPYPYFNHPYATGAALPINYVRPMNYPSTSSVYLNQRYNPYARMPIQYASQQAAYPLPPIVNRMPMMIQPPQQQPPPYIPQLQQQPRVYFYNPNRVNKNRPAAPVNKKTAKDAPKNNSTDGRKAQPTKSLISNNNDLWKKKNAKIRVSGVHRTNGFQDDSSDDEFERIPLDSPRPETLRQPSLPPKRSIALPQRIPSTASSCSHCSTCTNCSCSACRPEFHDDCPECLAERRQAQTYQSKRK